MRLVACAAVTLAFCTSAAVAQDVPFPPLVADLPQGYDFKDGSVIDVLGVSLGQPRADAEAALAKAFPAVEIRPDVSVLTLKDGGGNQFAVSYHAADEVSVPGSEVNYMQLIYTTAVSGERVTSIYRQQDFGTNQTDGDALIAALSTKYGKPTTDTRRSLVTLEWVWIDGKLAAPQKYAPGDCTLVGDRYSFQERKRSDQSGGCTAYVEVELYSKTQDMRISELHLKAISPLRAFDNAVATDTWLLGEFQKVVDAKELAPTPAL